MALYHSPPPRLIIAAARLLAVKSMVSTCACAWAAHAYALTPAALPLTIAALASPLVKMSLGFGALASLSALVSRHIVQRTVLRLELEPGGSGSGGGTLLVSTPRLLGAGVSVERVPAASVQGASANSTVQGFRVDGGGGRLRAYYLFPVEPHWRSSDPPALRRLLFAQYFREEEAAAAAAAVGSFGVSGPELMGGIEGFGPFRPALFADPRAAALPALEGAGEGSSSSSGSGSGSAGSGVSVPALASLPVGVRRGGGTVWADFVLPPPRSLEARRAREYNKKAGKPNPPTPLPSLPAALLPEKSPKSD